MTKQVSAIWIPISFLIVALAQPDWSPLACVLTSIIGYALFWKGMLTFGSKWARFFIALAWFGGVQAVHLNWFMADKYVGPPIFIFLFLLYGSLGLGFALLSLFVPDPKKLTIWHMLGLAGGWTLGEWGRLFFLSGFSWDPVGLALTGTLFGMQMASIVGVFGLTFWVIFANLMGLKMIGEPFSWSRAGLWASIAATPYLFGFAEWSFHEKGMREHTEPPLSVLAVQAAIMPEEKISYHGEEGKTVTPIGLWERLFALMAPHIDKPLDLIAFSESVLPFGTDVPLFTVSQVGTAFRQTLGVPFSVGQDGHKRVGNAYVAQALSNVTGSDVIIGLEDVERGIEPRCAYNACFLFTPGTFEKRRYAKRVLVPLGEYIPFEWCKGFLSKYGIRDSYTPGKEAKVFDGKRLPIGMSICYEETYGHLMRENRLKGAGILVNLTNDVWYPQSRLPMVHYLHGRLRAVEGGIPIVRSGNTGVTCVIDSLGRMVDCLEYERSGVAPQAGALHLLVPSYTYPTLYIYAGDLPVVLLSVLSVIGALISHLFFRKRLVVKDLEVLHLHKNDE